MPHSLPTNPSDNPAPRVTRRPSPLAMSAVRPHDDDNSGGIEWKRVGSALNRYKWLIAFITILGTGGAAVATRFIKPQYSAQATVWIDETARGGVDRGPIRQSQTFEPEAWLDLLRTYAVLDSVVHDLRLNVVFDPPLDSAATRSFAVAEPFRTGEYELRFSDDGRAYS